MLGCLLGNRIPTRVCGDIDLNRTIVNVLNHVYHYGIRLGYISAGLLRGCVDSDRCLVVCGSGSLRVDQRAVLLLGEASIYIYKHHLFETKEESKTWARAIWATSGTTALSQLSEHRKRDGGIYSVAKAGRQAAPRY